MNQEATVLTKTDFATLSAVLKDVDAACANLAPAVLERHDAAQKSVVEARRSAEIHEGLLQVC